MLPELSIITLLTSYESWCNNESKISVQDLPRELQGVYRVIDSHHRTSPGVDLSLGDVSNLFFATAPADRDFYIKLFEQLESLEVSEETTINLINSIKRNRVLQELSLASYEVTQGKKDFSVVGELIETINGLSQSAQEEQEEEELFVSTDLESLVNDTYLQPGLRWRLNTLNLMLGSLRTGDFGFIFARPESGKTTLIASESTFMATQVEPDECVAWINNEEEGKKVMVRAIQSALGLPLEVLMSDLKKYARAYHDLMGNRLRLRDNSKVTRGEIEKLCEKYKPRLLIFDQIDKIEGFQNDREDLRLGSIYQWAREIAKSYCPVIGVTQADGTGEGVRRLNMSHVANAKTAKQAEADWILGIGKDNSAGFESVRFLHLSKNKLQGDPDSDPEKRHGTEQVLIEPNIARYRDIVRG